MCVCVYNLRFSLFSHSSLRSALKFKQSAINYTCWALSIFHFSSFLHSALHFLWATQTFAYFGAPSRVSIRCWLIIAAASASMLRHSLRHSLRHCVTPPVWQSVTVPVQRSGSVSVGQKCDHSAAPCQGVAELGFANNFESNFHKLACHMLQPPLLPLLLLF